MLETATHLYQPVQYQGLDGNWHKRFADAIAVYDTELHWDTAAVLSYLSFDYICGNRTLIKEVRRQPWMSTISSTGEVQLHDIPWHDRQWRSRREIAKTLENLLCDEVLRVCQGRQEVYVLLSGGLDSRIVAGILAKLIWEGQLNVSPIAVTWGKANSRDVVYGRRVAETLGFEWIPVDLTVENLRENIKIAATEYGCQFSPVHLHVMSWFRKVSPQALVLAGSYGDSVGRAEFSRKHVLELDYLRPNNTFWLMSSALLPVANKELLSDLEMLHQRALNQPKYALCEIEMQAHYMRGLISAAMEAIAFHCDLYQVFTDPRVYSYMWSIHPVLRSDHIYTELLELLDKRLARIPWARTNQALRGGATDSQKNLAAKFHEYDKWISSTLYKDLCEYLDPTWFAQLALFDSQGISRLKKVAQDPSDVRAHRILVWLASLKRFVEWLEGQGKRVVVDEQDVVAEHTQVTPPRFRSIFYVARKKAQQSTILYHWWKRSHRLIYQVTALLKYPPRLHER